MLALAFLNPLLLWAIPLAAVPIVIHLLNRRRFKKVPWAAMEFLLAAMKRNRKRLRMEQWIVLLLRTLAVLFLVFLVARPQLAGGGLVGTTTHHVFLLDDSASMAQRLGSAGLFEKAQDRIRVEAEGLGQRRSGDLFSLVRTSHAQKPDLWAQRVGPDLGKRTGDLLKQLRVGDAAIDPGDALGETMRRARAQKDAGRTEYYLVGDLRVHDWLTAEDKPRPAMQRALASLQEEREGLRVLRLGSLDQDNLAVVGVRCQDRIATAGVPVTLVVEVENLGLQSSQPTEVAVEIDGKSRVVRPVQQLAVGGRDAIAVTHTFHGAGYHRVQASLPASDHYVLDDRRSMAIEVREKSKVLLVDGDPDTDGGETLFLQVALDPGEEASSGIEPQVVTDLALADVDLAPFDMVWLCNVQAPSAAIAQKLQAWVAAGGGLVVFAGPLVDGNRYNELFWQGGKGLLPMPFGEVAGDTDRPDHVFLAQKDHPICGGYGELLEALCAGALLVKRYVAMTEVAGGQAAVLARVRDAEGSPLIAARTHGSGGGEVVVFGFTASKQWSNWPDTPLNLVFAQQTHRFAARVHDRSGDNLGTRGTWRCTLDPGRYKADATVRAAADDGEEKTFTATEPKTADAPAPAPTPASGTTPWPLEVPMADLQGLGAYTVDLHQHGGETEQRMFARNPPLEESRMQTLTEGVFKRAFPPELHGRVLFVEASAGSEHGTGQGEIWRLLAALLLAGLLLESLLAWRFGRR
jgi:hypothetical protein